MTKKDLEERYAQKPTNNEYMESGYVYAPYIPIQITPAVNILPKDLALLRCHHCEKKLENNDEVYTIMARRYSEYDCDFTQLKNTQTTVGLNIAVPREVNFHVDCFLEIAGAEYAP